MHHTHHYRVVRRDAASRRFAFAALALALLGASMMLGTGCGQKGKTVKAPPNAPPPPSYTGPAFLRGTIGSMTSIRSGHDVPYLVEGFGIAFFPPGTGTGSSEVPEQLRQRLISEMRKNGLGSATAVAQAPADLKPFLSLSPQQVLDLKDTAVVHVRGLVPPGATKGTRFDLLISAVDTQTTSLTGATLWTTALAVNGANTSFEYLRPTARGHGQAYIDPTGPSDGPQARDWQRQAVVVLGGEVIEDRRVELVLNQPSWSRSRSIANRINERFGRNTDPRPIAEPQTDLLIRINVPARWAGRTPELMELIGHLFSSQTGPDFVRRKARELADLLREQPANADRIVLAWKALGPNSVPVLQELYQASDLSVQLAALAAGTYLGDTHASRTLEILADHTDPKVRIRVADALAHLPQSLQGEATLRRLLDDDNQDVRIAAYESLASINATWLVRRLPIVEGRVVKFIIDRVPSTRPLVYITQHGLPRIVIFGPEQPQPVGGGDLMFPSPMLARLWNNRLMLRASSPNDALTLFYQWPHEPKPKVLHIVPRSVGSLAYLMGHAPNPQDANEGLGLSYGQVVDAIYELAKDKVLDAPVVFNESPLAQQMKEIQNQPQQRPEIGVGEAESADTGGVKDATLNGDSVETVRAGTARANPRVASP